MLTKADNQPIEARTLGDDVWITDFITPTNPDVMLKYQELTKGLGGFEEIITACWKYVAEQPYVPYIASRLQVDGKVFRQDDTWFFPAESIRIARGNCANKSFVLTSLLKNYLMNPGEVYCVVGDISLDGIGSHAWVEVNYGLNRFLIETTNPDIKRALIPRSVAEAYNAKVYFDEEEVFTSAPDVDVAKVFESNFGLCAIDYLKNYLCERCLKLESVEV